MDELLRPVSVVRMAKNEAEPDFLRLSSIQTPSKNPEPTPPKSQHHTTPTTPEDALEILKHEPDYDSLTSILTFISRHETHNLPTIKLPSPLNAQLVQVLVAEIVPNYWALLVEDVEVKMSGLRLLLYCLSSITGVNAILVRLRALIQEAKSKASTDIKRPDIPLNLGILLDLLCRVLEGDGWVLEAYRLATSGHEVAAMVRPRLQETVATFGASRIISLAAEAEDILKGNASIKKADNIWPADSLQYTQWLGRNIVTLALSDLTAKDIKFGPDLFAKALRLGHSGMFSQRCNHGGQANIGRWTD
jgi:telomere length regulation protein